MNEAWRPPPNWNARFFLHFPKELSYGYLRFDGNGKISLGRTFSLPSQREFPIPSKPKAAIAKFIWKMKKKSGTGTPLLTRFLETLENRVSRKPRC